MPAPFSVLPMLVGRSTIATTNTFTSLYFKQSPHLVDFVDVGQVRVNAGCEITSGTAQVRFFVAFSLDSTTGDDGTWYALTGMTRWFVPGAGFTTALTPFDTFWNIANVPHLWIRAYGELTATGGGATVHFIDLHFK